jgi:hypothetical protein
MIPKFKLIGECGGKDQVSRAVLALCTILSTSIKKENSEKQKKNFDYRMNIYTLTQTLKIKK